MISTRRIDDTGEIDPPLESFSTLYDELKNSDQEHGDVSVTDEDSGWCISAHRDGRVVFGNLLAEGDKHMHPVTKEKVLELWCMLANGEIERIQAEPWRDGYT